MNVKSSNIKQDNFDEIFETLRKILEKFSKNFVQGNVKTDKPQYHLWSKNKIPIEGRKPKQIYFAGTIIQKNFVGFYYMPVYADTELKDFFEPELLSLLKGKSCFHIKKMDTKLKRQITSALDLGLKQYKKRGWL